HGIRVVAEERIAQTAQDVGQAVRNVYEAKPTALVHCGFGFGVVFVNPSLEALGWDPPRFMGTAFQNAWINEVMWNAILGWTGLDQYDEGNQVGQRFLDQFEARYGRRPQYCAPVVNRDIATVLLHAFADAHPLTPRGVKEALERVKMIPAASGAPGTRLSFGKWNRRGWMGAGYLVARRLDPDGVTSHLVDRFGADVDVADEAPGDYGIDASAVLADMRSAASLRSRGPRQLVGFLVLAGTYLATKPSALGVPTVTVPPCAGHDVQSRAYAGVGTGEVETLDCAPALSKYANGFVGAFPAEYRWPS